MGQPKYLAVESIRGFACFMVLVSHLSLTFFPYLHAFDGKGDPSANPIQSFVHESPLGFFYSGTSAVFIFFVLSGYIFTKIALKHGGSERIISMSIKRYPRLMLPALGSCLLAYVCFRIFDLSDHRLTDWIHDYGNFSPSLIGAVYNGMFDVFFLSGQSEYNPVLWTMKIELIGSFVIFFLCFNKIRLGFSYLPVVSLFAVAFLLFLGSIDLGLGLGLLSFLGGFLFCLYGGMVGNKLSIALLVFGLYLAGVHNESWSYTLVVSLLGDMTYNFCNFLSGFFIVYAIIFNEKLNTLFSGRLGVFMGKVSFSVYLLHMPIISTFGVFTFVIFSRYINEYTIAAILTSVVSILFTYMVALVYYKLVDSQGMKVSDSLANLVVSRGFWGKLVKAS